MEEHAELEVYKRMLERERNARASAEKFLEQKSLELYEANQNLEHALSLHRREAFYLKTILDSATDGIVTINGKGRIETANPSAGRIFKSDPDQLVGFEVVRLLSDHSASMVPTPDNRYLADLCTEKEPVIEAIGICLDGAKIALELSASFGEVDDALLITWVIRDVSFIQALKRRGELSQRLEGIGSLAAGIAHEINTPVQFVHENTKFLSEAYSAIECVLAEYERNAELSDGARETINRACPKEQLQFYRTEVPIALRETKSGAKRIAQIVSAVKQFSHPGTNEKTLVDMNRAVESAATVTANNWRDAANLELQLDDTVPIVSCFSAQINQVLVNLIVNAVDAIVERDQQESCGLGKITITTGSDADSVFFSVADTGTGIEASQLDRIFSPFYTTKPVGKGTGQGLSITHAIVVENHGGVLDVESTVGEGTTFLIKLPRSKPGS